MNEEAASISGRFSLMMDQFTKYKSDVENYKQYLEGVLKKRTDARAEGNPENQGNKEQKAIIDSLAQVQTVIDQYA